jgi:transcription initiation factor TFIID subunit 7
MKKKFVEAPEIEKEVKRLLRVDNDALDVKWELVTEDAINTKAGGGSSGVGGAGGTESGQNPQNLDDLFGNLSDSDEDDERESSRAEIDIDSEGDSNLFNATGASGANTSLVTDEPSSSMTASTAPPTNPTEAMVTSFSKDMFPSSSQQQQQQQPSALAMKMEALQEELSQLKTKKQELERNIAKCDNQLLLRRFEQSLSEMADEVRAKEEEIDGLAIIS